MPSAAAAGRWERTEPSAAGAWEEVPWARQAGSAKTPGRGELLGFRWRRNPWIGEDLWSEKRAKVLPLGRTPHRSGAVPPSGQLHQMAKAANDTGEITCFSHMLWPKYGGDYPEDEVIAERSVKEGIFDLLHDPSKQWGSQLVYFK